MSECSIGFFEDGDAYAGKNWDPGMRYFSTVLKSERIETPQVFYTGLTNEETSISSEMEQAYEDDRIFRPESLSLYRKERGEEISPEFSTLHRDGAVNVDGTFPLEQFSAEPEDPVQPFILVPSEGYTSVGIASPFNYDECWAGMNEKGVWACSSALKHDGRSDYDPYAGIMDDVLGGCISADEGVEMVEERLLDGPEVKGANLMIADSREQYLIEYVPGSSVGGERSLISTSSGDEEFRAN
ncbi:MAG: hypothetical protein ABEJ03_01330, partial [Candidatus Nanohaloarchaea archaeon]